MADIEYNVGKAPPPVPPKDDLRPMTPPKDFPRIKFQTSESIGPSTSKISGLEETISESLSISSNTFPGAKRQNKVSSTHTNVDSIFIDQDATSNNQPADHEPRKETHRSDSMFTKLSWWLSWGRSKPKNHNNVKFTEESISTTNIPSSSSLSSPPIIIQIPNDNNDGEAPKVKKSNSITNLFRRFSYRRRTERKENSSSTVVEESTSTNNNFSTVPSSKPSRRKSNFGSLIERLTKRKFSFTFDQRKASETTKNRSTEPNLTNPTENNNDDLYTNNDQIKKVDNKLKQKELVVQGQDLTASSNTLCQVESTVSQSTQSTAAETLNSLNNNDHHENMDLNNNMDIDAISPLRHSIAKSSNSSERADDDTIKGVSGTIRHSRIFDIFTAKKDISRRSSIATRTSLVNINQMSNGIPPRHIRINSNNMKESLFNSSPLSSNSYKPYDTDNNKSKNSPKKSETENKNMIISRDDEITSELDDKIKTDKSPLRLFKKKFYQSLRPSQSNSETENTKKHIETSEEYPIISSVLITNDNNEYEPTTNVTTLQEIHKNCHTAEVESDESDSDNDRDLDDMTLDDGVEGDVSATQSQAPESSLNTGSEYDASSHKKSMSRMSSFSKSFNSEDPSAFSTTFSDSQPSQFNESDVSKLDWPMESAWDVLLNSTPTTANDRKGPARLSNNRLSYIPNHFFEGLHNLKELYLDRNSLRDLPEELLKLTKLEILDLSNNCISEFHPRLKFRRMKNLRRLNLDNNVLSDVTSITKLKTLRELRANNNLLGSISTDISKLAKLRLLYLDSNQLTSLPDSIGRLKSLCVLRLNNNNVEGLPAAICSLHQLQVLELRSNLLSSLPENIKELENLAKLDISNNKLTSLPNELVKCNRLTHLNAHNNLLESIPSKFGQLSRLLTLNLRENRLINLPADIGKLTSLTELDLSHNELVVLPEDLGKLIKLTEIKLNNNPSLLAIPNSFQKLALIRKVHLQHCSLSQIPFEMGVAYNQLTYVNLSYNHFDTMPKLQGMDHVISFNISNNRITDLTEQIDQLEMLRELYVINNKLTHLPKSIGRLKKLEIMDFSENILVDLPISIGDCVSLRELKLRGNSIENLPITLGKLTGLNVFYVGQWPSNGFSVTQDEEDRNQNLKISSYRHKIPHHVERNLLWRMHDSILKRLRDIDNDGASEFLQSPSNESNNSQQDVTSHPPSPTPSPPRDDVILKMAVLKGVYDQIMRDMRNNDYDKESSGDDTNEFPGEIEKKKKFAKFKFLKIGDKQ
ncbi:6324_t:CDS:2 [Funneliformis geosporum]|uniref:15592_t:CDS:1 n=1 Tax=Funneliformis geosporum TaxID=1117311 RepID=A0A9W4WPA1_9GLOM|nr:15592_t:CDS:2 [Funneliformis geosporum]CAI2165670.1 6324_t:CDS:2 [Funneliformis geosporum]